jgi:hypothetical protein
MRPLSATECISPAIARTKLILFTPFRMGRTWKLSATSYLSIIGTMFFPFPLVYLFILPAAWRAGGARAAVALIIGVLLLTALCLYIFHLCSRIQFAYFDILVNRGEFVAPAWRKYGPQSRRWTGIKVLLGIAATLASAVPILAYFRHLLPLLQTLQSMGHGQQPPLRLIGVFYASYGIFLLVFGFFFLVSSLLADFIVPSLALENTSLAEAFRRMGALIRQEPGEFALYTLLKIGLAIATVLGATIAWEIVFLLCSLIIGAIVLLFGFLLHLIGIPSIILTVFGVLLAIAWYIFGVFYVMLLGIGPIYTFLDAYALYFLGGRYPLLGDLLDRSTPPPAYAYAFPPPPPPYQPPQPLQPTQPDPPPSQP